MKNKVISGEWVLSKPPWWYKFYFKGPILRWIILKLVRFEWLKF